MKTLPEKNSHIWVNMKDVQNDSGVRNMSDIILKELHSVYKTKNPTKEQVKEYKMTEREHYERFDNLSEKELNKKIIKKFVLEMMLCQLLLNVAGVKKKRHKSNR